MRGALRSVLPLLLAGALAFAGVTAQRGGTGVGGLASDPAKDARRGRASRHPGAGLVANVPPAAVPGRAGQRAWGRGGSEGRVRGASQAPEAPAASGRVQGLAPPRAGRTLASMGRGGAPDGRGRADRPGRAGTGGGASAPAQGPGAGGAASALAGGVSFVGLLHDGRQVSGARFQTAQLRDLMIVVQWVSLVGEHTQRLDLITPDGSVYQRLRTAVASADGQARVETRLPVGGTWITDYALHGTWAVDVYLDDGPSPFRRARFVLTK